MPISWNEIRHNAIKFSGEWKGATSESAEKQTFWNEFFQVFGIKRRVVASFEEPARRISGTYGFIDLLWRGVLLVEHKSFGEDLGKAKAQAFNYIRDLANEGRHAEIPRYIIVSDFARVALHDLEPEEHRDLLAAREPHLPPRGLGTLADLYAPLSMPPALAKAHAELDRAVEKCYRPEPFDSDRQRVEFLFALYEKLTAPLLPVTPKTKSRRSSRDGGTATTPRPRKQKTPGLSDQTPPLA